MMATGRKKCICQICTCGKHICPHRKKASLVLKEIQNGENGVTGAADVNKSKSVPKNHIVKTGEKKRSIIKKTREKGRSESLESWSSKQIPKTLSMKPADNLKNEGIHDLSTIHQQDFTEKHLDDDYYEYRTKTQADTIRKESWSKKYVPKTLSIKNPDSLKATGYQDFRTTHGVSYTDITPVGDLSKQEENGDIEDGGKVKKQKRPRPVTSLKSEGEFLKESLYQKDFTPREVDLSPRHRPTSHLKHEGAMEKESLYQKDFTPRAKDLDPRHRPNSNIKIEGPRYFTTTSLDYKTLEELAATTEDGLQEFVFPKRHRPQSQIRIPDVPLAADSTVATDFPRWNVPRPYIWKPKDNLQKIADMQSIDENELLEQIKRETYHGSANVWNVSRKSSIKLPFDDTQRDDEEIIPEDIEDIGAEKMSPDEGSKIDVTEDIAEIEPEIAEVQEQEPAPTPEEHSGNGGEIFDTSGGLPVSDEQIYNGVNGLHSPEDDGDENEYLTWDQIRPEPIRPQSNLRQHGKMHFSTTNRSEFINRPMERVRGFRPKTTTRITGDFHTETTNQAMFGQVNSERAIPIRPRSNLHLENGIFIDETTSAREFQPWHVEKPQPYVHKSTLAQEGDMEFSTTHHREFEAKDMERVSPFRPKSGEKVYGSDGEFDGMTTSRLMHPKFESEKVHSFRPHSNLKINTGLFTNETTNQREFQEWGFDKMSPFRPKTTMKQEGKMDFTTMNQMQFHEKKIELVNPIRPMERSYYAAQGNNMPPEGDFDFTTTTQEQYGQKPIHLVRGEKPRSASKPTGEFDDTTTTHAAFQNGTGEKAPILRPQTNMKCEGDFSKESLTQSEYKQWELSKQGSLKPKSSVRQEGEFRDATTSREMSKFVSSEKHGEYLREAKEMKEPRPHSTEMVSGQFIDDTIPKSVYHTPQHDRAERIRYRDHIRMLNASFNDETTSRREYVYRQADRAEPIKPKSSLGQEGGFNFVTSNQIDFEKKTAVIPPAVRPKTMTRPNEGEFYATTTNQVTYRTPGTETDPARQAERPPAVVYSDTLKQEGNMQFETTNRTEFSEKTTEHPIAIRPRTTTRIEGDLDITTTNQIMYPNYEYERVHPIRQKDNLAVERGKFNDETTSRREFKQWVGMRRSKDAKPIKHLKAAGVPSQRQRIVIPTPDLITNMLDTSEATNVVQTEQLETVEEKAPSPKGEDVPENGIKSLSPPTSPKPTVTIKSPEVETEVPTRETPEIQAVESPSKSPRIERSEIEPILTENQNYVSRRNFRAPKRFKPIDNLRFDNVPFESNTTTSSEFVKWEAGRSSSKRRSPHLKQEGSMRFATTSEDYALKDLDEKRTKHRTLKPHENLRHSGAMEFSTTNQTVYLGNSIPKTRNLRPKSTLKLGGADDGSSKTTTQGARKHEMTTESSSYKGYTIGKTRVNRPSTSQKVGEGQFEGKSTTQTVFTGPKEKMEKTRSFKPDSSHILAGNEEFHGNTTYRCSFDVMKSNHNCPVLELDKGSKFQFKEEVNGHRFYLPLVLG